MGLLTVFWDVLAITPRDTAVKIVIKLWKPREYHASRKGIPMSDVNRGNRPLSPHMSIYRPQLTSITSILTRITGNALLLGGLLVIAWLMAAAISAECFATVDGILRSWFGKFIMLGSLWALWYHLLAGVRHLIWDQGWCMEMDIAEKLGWAVVIGSVVLTVLTVVIL